MSERELKLGIEINKTKDFLLGININIGRTYSNKRYGYLCIYLGFRQLIIGRDYFIVKER